MMARTLTSKGRVPLF